MILKAQFAFKEAESMLSLQTTEQQNDKRCCVRMFWKNAVAFVKSMKRVLKMLGSTCAEQGMPATENLKVCC